MKHTHWLSEDTLKEICFENAMFYLQNKKICNLEDIEQIANIIYQSECEKYERSLKIEKLLDYDDEIIEIVELNDEELIDITVTNDSLFYANGILTKNSLGTVMTADVMIGIIRSEELDELGQCIFKCLKTRFSDLTNHRSVIGIEEAKMKLTNVDAPGFVAQTSPKHQPQAKQNSFESKFGGVDAPRRSERTGMGEIQV